MPLPTVVRTKLKKMILLMGSANVGESQAARTAIDRILKANNSDWHELAAALDGGPPPATPARQRSTEPVVQDPDSPIRARNDGRFEVASADMMQLVGAIRQHVVLDAWSTDFLLSMEDRAMSYDPVVLSEKQLAIVRRMLMRVPA